MMEPGSRLGRYEIEARIGAGAFAVVYRALDHETGERRALKILTLNGEDDREELFRFKREYRAMARLSHPHLVKVHGEGLHTDPEDRSEHPYLVMDLVEGVSLTTFLSQMQTMEVPDRQLSAVSIAAQICAGLAYVHGLNIVHRDIKPGNVMLDSDGRVRLMDFGIARVLDDPGQVTRAGALLGTLAYMAPEQAMGHRLDGRADLYSLGVLLYEMLTGERPFEADDPIAFLYQHTREPPRPPRELTPALNVELEAITLKLLSKRPEDRFPDAEATAAALAQAVPTPKLQGDPLDEDAPVSGRGPSPTSLATARTEALGGARPLLNPPLVGRRSELRRMRSALAEAATGRGGSLLLRGAEGLGKTRLVELLCDEARSDGALVLSSRGLGRNTRPFGPFRSILEQAARAMTRRRFTETGHAGAMVYRDGTAVSPAQLPRSFLRRVLPVLGVTFPEFARILRDTSGEGGVSAEERHLPPPIDQSTDPLAHRRWVVACIAAVVEHLAARARLVLVIEDHDEADQASRLAIGELRERFARPESRALLLLTEASAGGPAPMMPSTDPEAGAEQTRIVELGPLSRDDIGVLIRGMLPASPLPEPVVDRLYAVTSGNPQLAVETVRHLARTDQISRSEMSSELVIPGSVRELLKARSSGLGMLEHRVLEAAAVLATPFSFSLMQAVLCGAPSLWEEAGGPPSEDALLDALDGLARRDLIGDVSAQDAVYGMADGGDDGLRYGIINPALETVVYGEVPPEQRIALHRAAALALEAASGGLEGKAARTLAHHFVEGKVLDRAPDYLIAAAEESLDAGGLRKDALGYLDQAERVLPAQTPDAPVDHRRMRCLHLRALTHLRMDDIDQAEGALTDYRDALWHEGGWRNNVEGCRCEVLSGEVALMQAELERASRHFDGAVQLAELSAGEDTDAQIIRELETAARLGQAAVHTRFGSFEEAAGIYGEVLRIPGIERWTHHHCRAEAGLALIHYFAAELEPARERALRAFELSRQAGDMSRAVGSLVVAVSVDLMRASYDEAYTEVVEAAALARIHDEPFRLCETLVMEAAVLLETGQPQAALERVDPRAHHDDPADARALADLERYPSIDFLADMARGRARLEIDAQDERGMQLLRRALEKAERLGSGGFEVFVMAYVGQAEAIRGNPREAIALAARALKAAQAGTNVLGIEEAHITATMGALAIGEHARARRHAQEAARLAGERQMATHEIRARALLARIAEAESQSAEAEREWKAAEQVVRRVTAELQTRTASTFKRRSDVAEILSEAAGINA